jgi:hypothetical protein
VGGGCGDDLLLHVLLRLQGGVVLRIHPFLLHVAKLLVLDEGLVVLLKALLLDLVLNL